MTDNELLTPSEVAVKQLLEVPSRVFLDGAKFSSRTSPGQPIPEGTENEMAFSTPWRNDG
jgi:hypothetical protein